MRLVALFPVPDAAEEDGSCYGCFFSVNLAPDFTCPCVTAHSPQGLDVQDRAIRGLSMHGGRVQLVWMQRIEGSDSGPRVS